MADTETVEKQGVDPAKVIDDYFSEEGYEFGAYTPIGQEAVEEAKRAGIDLAIAMAMVEQESKGRNVFGCDFPDLTADRPPFCQHRVTQARVRALMASPYQNGVGVTQLTYWAFVEDAEREGGAHLPRYQMRVGFGVLQDYITKYPYLEALGAYNAGEANRWAGLGYAQEVAAKQLQWRERLSPSDVVAPPPDTDWPTEIAAVSANRWLYNQKTNEWIKTPNLPDGTKLIVEGGRWIRVIEGETPVEPPPGDWQWPTDNQPVGWIGDGSYQDVHPSRWNFRADVEQLARRVVNKWGVSANTYLDHPPSYWRDVDSVDFWDKRGRGYTIDSAVGQAIFDELFNDPNKPDIEWIIWWGWIWIRDVGWRGYPSDPHYDHVHITYQR